MLMPSFCMWMGIFISPRMLGTNVQNVIFCPASSINKIFDENSRSAAHFCKSHWQNCKMLQWSSGLSAWNRWRWYGYSNCSWSSAQTRGWLTPCAAVNLRTLVAGYSSSKCSTRSSNSGVRIDRCLPLSTLWDARGPLSLRRWKSPSNNLLDATQQSGIFPSRGHGLAGYLHLLTSSSKLYPP